MKKLILISGVLLLTITACKKEVKNNATSPSANDKGAYVINEGAFNAGNASVSFINTGSGKVTNDLFSAVNGFPLGDVAQSMTINNGKGYIVVNNSKKIEVVNMSDFSSITTISSGLSGPRYLVVNNNKAYVSDWFSDNIKIIDLNSNTIIKSLTTGSGPEQMVIAGNNLYVANVGGYGMDSTVTIIDLNADTVITSLQVGLNPNSIVQDANGKIWVLCGGSIGADFTGGTSDDIAGSLLRINPTTNTIDFILPMSSAHHPIKLQINKGLDEMYFLQGNDGYTGKIYTLNINSPTVLHNVVPVKEFYGLGVDPESEVLFGAYVPGFSQDGYVFRYTASGSLIDSSQVGIAPSFFSFK